VRSAEEAAREGARAEIEALATAFADAAEPIVRAALERRVTVLLHAGAERLDELGPEVADALREAAASASSSGAAEIARRLREPDVWLRPLTAPGLRPPTPGWDGSIPDWISGFLRRFSRREEPGLGPLDDLGNRIWVALRSAANPVAAVFQEFGLQPAAGARTFELLPKTAAQLDPSGTLQRLWKRYRVLHTRFVALERLVESSRRR
jgi:hypothetical protein